MSAAASLPNPVRVSPLIRVSRWSFLALGILWGIKRQNSNSNKEARYQAQVELERPAKDAARAAEKQKLYREEMLYLARETGTPVPENF